MLSFKQQQIVLRPILERQTNKHCADCGSHTPTWASLDFGVFVCSNCSGAHRALGPTITRIKSTKLDQWNRDWVQNMRIGNLQINQFWEADSKTATSKKPRWGASLDEHNRYVYDKYVRRKFVTDKTGTDPLKSYKNGNYVAPTPVNIVGNNNLQNKKNPHLSSPIIDIPSIVQLPKKLSQTVHVKKNSFNLLDDDPLSPPVNTHKQEVVHHASSYPQNTHQNNGHKDDQDQFTDYVDPVNHSNGNHQTTHTQQEQKDPSKMSFDQLMKNPQGQTQNTQQPQLQPHYQQAQHPQWNMYGQQQNAYGNFGYQQGYMPQQQYINQFAHNPYIGYAPHNPLHASYNYTGYNGHF